MRVKRRLNMNMSLEFDKDTAIEWFWAHEYYRNFWYYSRTLSIYYTSLYISIGKLVIHYHKSKFPSKT